MSDLKLGVIIDAHELRERDAIHIAVASVIAGEPLQPGQHVGFIEDSTETVVGIADGMRGAQNKEAVGIVDPFLTVKIYAGQRFWLFLYPNTITSLRHDWTHPAFSREGTDPVAQSRRWIETFAAELDQTYGRLMLAAETWIEDENYTYDNTERYKDVDAAKWPLFWKHYETVTGTAVKDHDATFFTCSC